MVPGSACEPHAATWQVGLTARQIDNLIRAERPGAIGPVPRIAFAYVAGVVPKWNDDGERVT